MLDVCDHLTIVSSMLDSIKDGAQRDMLVTRVSAFADQLEELRKAIEIFTRSGFFNSVVNVTSGRGSKILKADAMIKDSLKELHHFANAVATSEMLGKLKGLEAALVPRPYPLTEAAEAAVAKHVAAGRSQAEAEDLVRADSTSLRKIAVVRGPCRAEGESMLMLPLVPLCRRGACGRPTFGGSSRASGSS